ncbi:hypothetical protein [Embleya scabrispora]|uniref:hypothetical protein n=1 Tax=Embleya scabrispora TaxID=159449 RepID=UPI00036419A5|nr:hypothetical protein [Embleya scabrispora]MYS80739.1 hypothetical protein [Streptomyces sp. SID5474]
MPASSSPSTDASSPGPDGPELRLANEFASIRLRKVRFGNASRIEVRSERQDRTVLLDPMALDAITRLTPDQISRILTLVTENDQ